MSDETDVNVVGPAVARSDWVNAVDIFVCATQGDADATSFLTMLCSLRVSRRRPLLLQDPLNDFSQWFVAGTARRSARFKKLRFCMNAFYSTYLCMRCISHPMNVRTDVAIPLTRGAQRVFASTGQVRYEHVSAADRAARNLNTVWRELAGRQCVLWVDNFYSRRRH